MVGVAPLGERGAAQQLGVLIGVVDGLSDHEHHRVDRLCPCLSAVVLDGDTLGFQQTDAVQKLGRWVGTVVLAPDQDRRFDEPVGDRRRQRIAVDDLLRQRPFVRGGSQADQGPRRKVSCTDARHVLGEHTAELFIPRCPPTDVAPGNPGGDTAIASVPRPFGIGGRACRRRCPVLRSRSSRGCGDAGG